MKSAVRRERFAARIEPDEKRTLERAAELRGSSLTEFVMSSAREAAFETIERYENMVLIDQRDKDAFVAAMLNPPAPSARLKAAAKRYRASTGAAKKEHL